MWHGLVENTQHRLCMEKLRVQYCFWQLPSLTSSLQTQIMGTEDVALTLKSKVSSFHFSVA